jgi:hypothetical protein
MYSLHTKYPYFLNDLVGFSYHQGLFVYSFIYSGVFVTHFFLSKIQSNNLKGKANIKSTLIHLDISKGNWP